MYFTIDLKNITNGYLNIQNLKKINYCSKNIPFDLIEDNRNNNISCENQLIAIKSKNVKSLYLLGHSEISYFNDEITLFYKDESIDICTFLIKVSNKNYRIDNTDWLYINNNRCYEYYKFGDENKLYVVYIKINNKYDIELEYLKLPYNPNIYIYSITYEII